MKPKLRGYQFVGQIGNGAGTLIYKVRQEATGQCFAVKHTSREVLKYMVVAAHPELPAATVHVPLPFQRTIFAQLKNERKMLRHLQAGSQSQHVVRFQDLKVKRRCFVPAGYDLIMECLEGKTLRDQRTYPIRQVIDLYYQSALALDYCHGSGVIHGDVKPQHLFVQPDGTVKLIDFGLSFFRDRPPRRVQGTPAYMPYEQTKGRKMDERSDIYSLGATMFWVLTGKSNRPAVTGLGGTIDFTVAYAQRGKSVRELNPDVPAELDELIIRSCEKEMDQRPQYMADVLHVLRKLRRRHPWQRPGG